MGRLRSTQVVAGHKVKSRVVTIRLKENGHKLRRYILNLLQQGASPDNCVEDSNPG